MNLKYGFDMFLLNLYRNKLTKKEKKNNLKKNLKKLKNLPTYCNTDIPDTQLKICRVCYDDKETKKNPLIYPCKCCGTSKWIHKECLLKWIDTSNNYKCPQCQYKYIINKKTKYPILEKIKNYNTTIIISLLLLSIYLLTITIKFLSYLLKKIPYSNIFKYDLYFFSISLRVFNFIIMFSLGFLTFTGNISMNEYYIYNFELNNQYGIFKFCLKKIRQQFIKKLEKYNESITFIENYSYF